MLHYRLPPKNHPDYVIILSAIHAEAFLRASKAAVTFMGAIRQAQGTYGVLKSGDAYMAGPFDFKKVLVQGGSVDELDMSASHLEADKVTVAELKKQLIGHIRAALTEAAKAAKVDNIYLIFYAGAPIIIIRDEGPENQYRNTPYRVALVRFEGASSMAEEQNCVEANRASRQAYSTLWIQLEEQARMEEIDLRETMTDVLDEPSEHRPLVPASSFAAAPAEPSQPINLDDEEDMIDGMGTALAPTQPVGADQVKSPDEPVPGLKDPETDAFDTEYPF